MADSSLRMRIGVFAVVAIGCLAAFGTSCGGSSTPASAEAASATAREYVEAYNHRDGETICKVFSDELREWFTHVPGLRPGSDCPEVAAAYIGYGEESDTPTFQQLEILSVRPTVTGAEAHVALTARYHFKAFPKPLARVFTDHLYFVSRAGDWRLVKPGGVYFATRSAYQVPENALDPPLTEREAHSPAPQPRADFECSPSVKSTVEDAVGDAPPSLDIRRVAASVNPDGSVCLRFLFAAAPRPGTDLELRLEQPQLASRRGVFYLTEASVRIGSRGRFHFTVLRHEDGECGAFLPGGLEGG